MAYLLWHDVVDSAQRFPSRPAVACRKDVLTYEEMDRQSSHLAQALNTAGVGRGHRVGLYLDKSPRTIVAMLGVLKAGAAYVPIDPRAPVKRAAFIMTDCSVSALIGDGRRLSGLADAAGELPRLRAVIQTDTQAGATPQTLGDRSYQWDELAAHEGKGSDAAAQGGVESDPAYVLYTSGSTGNPKGVVSSHRNAISLVEWAVDTFAIGPNDRFSNHAPLHFALSVTDVYATLRAGACMVMVPDEVAPYPIELARWIDAERISIWYSVPSALILLLLHGDMGRFEYGALRTVLFAGEVFPLKYLRDLMARLPRARYYNIFGMTETNICTYYPVPPIPPEQTEDIPMGNACRNTEIFAVDAEGRLAPPGEEGELMVRGPTVMLGYWGLPEKNAQSLVTNPLQPAYQERVFRTGNYVRLRRDGCYEFLGRKDHQVKSRGYRIELGEIEQTLYQHDQIREAVVLALPDEEIGARLKAVVVLNAVSGAPGSTQNIQTELEKFCRDRLPAYMVPEEFLVREDLPRTSTGKANRVRLREELLQGSSSKGDS